MKTMTRFISMAALALAGAIITACSGSDDTIADTPQQPENQNRVITLTTTVGLGDGSATTRALTIDYENKKAVKTFAANDQMAVIYKNTSGNTKKAVADITSGAGTKSATFTVTLDDPDCNAPIRYIYPAAMAKETVATNAEIDDAGTVDLTKLNAQDGTMDALGSALDLCTFDATSWTSGELPSAELENQLAVLAVTVKDDKATEDTEDDEPITASVTRLTVSDGTNKYTATGCDADGHIYLAVLPTTDADITVDIYTGDYATTGHHYVKALADKKSYAASNLYNVGWKVNQYAEPMTVEALTSGTIVVNDPRSGMQYSKNGGAKAAVTSVGGTITVEAGDKVEFYGDGQSITSYYVDDSDHTTIAGGTADVKVYGNIMSLLDEAGFATATELNDEGFTFSCLFDNNQKLKDASGLLLPATMMLPDNCYEGMFSGCTGLTTAPALPATTLANHCYSTMFYGCTNLTAAPELPATELVVGCYFYMFAGCESLTAAPALPAEMLYPSCYAGMFQGCYKLSAVTCLATDISAEACTTDWLGQAGDQAEGTKTFTKAASMTGWPTNDEYINNGIPSNWTVVDYVAPTQ